MEQKVILLTGFGPFRGHKINASWESVKLLNNEIINDKYKIVAVEIPVVYNYVEDNIWRLWDKYEPHLVIHVGVSAFTRKLQLEKQAFRTGYIAKDCLQQSHKTGEFCSNSDDCLQTGLDLERICNFMESASEIGIQISENAGRYLCEFTYYASLNIDKTRTLFIHVPPLGEPHTAEEMSTGIRHVIIAALKQLD